MNDPAMGAGIWLGAVLRRLRHAADNRAAQLSDAAAMTDEERQRFSRRLREANAEIERLAADLAVAEANLNIAKANLYNERIINERLRAALTIIGNSFWTDGESGSDRADQLQHIARRALEPKP
jgi:hypothetical protein